MQCLASSVMTVFCCDGWDFGIATFNNMDAHCSGEDTVLLACDSLIYHAVEKEVRVVLVEVLCIIR